VKEKAHNPISERQQRVKENGGRWAVGGKVGGGGQQVTSATANSQCKLWQVAKSCGE